MHWDVYNFLLEKQEGKRLNATAFAVFGSRKVPGAVRYLGNMLPPAVMATLVF